MKMSNIDSKYDFVGEYHQGIAIVVKDGMYGAILMGGHEIIKPCYDYISSFKDGYAKAIRKGDCKILDLSGRECKKYEGNYIAVPTKYDTVRDFINGYACVQIDGKWGVIDTESKEIFEPQFDYLSDFVGGTAKYYNRSRRYDHSWGYLNIDGFCSECNLKEPEIEPNGNLIIERHELRLYGKDATRRVRINNKGQLLVANGDSVVALPKDYLIANDFKNGLAIVQDSTGYWGVINISGKIVVPLQYKWIQDFSENKAFALNKNQKLCLISSDGTIIKVFDNYTNAQPFKNGYSIVYEIKREGVINADGEELLAPISGFIHRTILPDEFDITSSLSEGKRGLFNASTGLFIKPLFKRIIEIKKDYAKVEVDGIGESLIDFTGRSFIQKDERIYLPEWCLAIKPLCNNIYLGLADNGEWGLVDNAGETLCMPLFDSVGEVNDEIIPLEKKATIIIGPSWNQETKEITKYGLYNIKSKVLIPIEYDVCPEYSNGFYKVTSKGLIGAINGYGEVVLKPEWNHIYLSNGYYVICKIVKYEFSEEKKQFGLADQKGKIVLEVKYNEIFVLRNGLYKIKDDYFWSNSWSLFNDKGRLTTESYDEIDLEGDYIIVSKKGIKGLLNDKAEKVIRTEDGNYVILPSKFDLGYKYENGIAKVLINGYENYVDKSFNIVINKGNNIYQVDKSIDYLVKEDENGNFIFVSEKKYGLINNHGEIVIDAKYQHLSAFANKLYIAAIQKREERFDTYGIIDINDNTILDFEYSSIKHYDGKVSSSYSLWENDYDPELICLSENEDQFWLIGKNGYGLIDSNAHLCISPKYSDILKFKNGFFVRRNEKYGVIALDFNVVCEPKYNSIKPLDNGLWKVSITSSQTYSSIEVYGILDSFGNEILEPIFQSINDEKNNRIAPNRATINHNGKLGIVDDNYFIIVEPQYNFISKFKNGKAIVKKDYFNNEEHSIICGEIDINGVFTDVSEITKTDLSNFVKSNKTSSYIKIIKTLKNGYEVIQREEPQYCAIIDKDNNIIVPYKYYSVEELDHEFYRVSNGSRGQYGLLDKNFNEIVSPKYVFIGQIQDDVFVASKYVGLNKYFGLINAKEDVIIPFEYSSITKAMHGYVWISINEGELFGLASINGNIIFEPKYGSVRIFKNGLATVNNGFWRYDEDSHYRIKEFREREWGVINTSGEIVLDTIFDSIVIGDDSIITAIKSLPTDYSSFSSEQKVTGHYNQHGELIIKNRSGAFMLASKKYDWQEDFNTSGLSTVYYKGRKGFVNENYQQIISIAAEDTTTEFILPKEYDWGYESIAGLIIVEKDNKKGIIDINCHVLVRCNYDMIDVLSDGNTVIFKCGITNGEHTNDCISYTWSILNKDGIPIINNSFDDIKHIGFSLLAIKSETPKYSIVDFSGQSTSNIYFDAVQCFGSTSNSSSKTHTTVEKLDYAVVEIAHKFGIIDNRGRLVISPKYNSLSIRNNNQFLADGVLINTFEQRIVFKDNSLLYSINGYESIKMLDNGLLLVEQNKLYGCINQIGTIIIPLKYKSLIYQNNLLIAVVCEETDNADKLGIINFQEKQIVPFSSHIEDIEIKSDIILYKQNGNWGAYTLQGWVICEPLYDHIVRVTDNLIKVGVDDKYYENYWEDGYRYDNMNYKVYWGLIDNTGNQILPLEYRSIADKAVNGLVEIRQEQKLGYVDVTGHLLLEPTYKSIGNFDDGYAIVSEPIYYEDETNRCQERPAYGVINSNFAEIIPCIFRYIEYIKESGRFETEYGYRTLNGRHIVDVDGRELFLDKKYKYCEPFNDISAIAVCINGKYGLIDKKANDILPPIFSRLDYIDKGVYKFKINGLYGLVNDKGEIILQNIFNSIGKFEDNLACVFIKIPSDKEYDKNYLYGYVDIFGNEILSPSYEFIGKRNNKYAVIMKNNLWGLFGIESHQIKIIPQVAFLGACMDNLCKINVGGIYDKTKNKTIGGLWGYVSVNGQIVIAPTYEQAFGFSDGLAAVKFNSKWGFINVEGEFVVPCEYDEVESVFEDGEGKLVRNGEVFVFDTSGRQIDSYEQYNEDEDYYESYNDDSPTYSKYGGYNGYSDQTIDEAFDGDPSLTWNCD